MLKHSLRPAGRALTVLLTATCIASHALASGPTTANDFSKIEARAVEDSKLSGVILSQQFGPIAYQIGTLLAAKFGQDNPFTIGLIEYAATSPHADLQFYVASNYYNGGEGFQQNPEKALYWSLRAMQNQESPYFKNLALMASSIAEDDIPNTDAAMAYAQKCIDVQPDGACYTRKARLLEDAGNMSIALPVYEEGDRLNDGYASWRLGMHYLDSDLTQATHYATRAITAGNPFAYSLMADIHLRYYNHRGSTNDLNAAINMASMGIARKDVSSYSRKGYAQALKAIKLNKKNYQTKALQTFQDGVEHGDEQSALLSAEQYRAMQKPVEALAYLELYKKVAPDARLPGDLNAYRDLHASRLSTFQKIWVSAQVDKMSKHFG
jgi:tetratricopeptide (TPR) repeat protein